MFSYSSTPDSPYDPTKLALHSTLCLAVDPITNFGENFKRKISFDDMGHFIDEKNVVTSEDSDCGITFYTRAPGTINQFNWEKTSVSNSCENFKGIPSNYQQSCFNDEEDISNVFVDAYNL